MANVINARDSWTEEEYPVIAGLAEKALLNLYKVERDAAKTALNCAFEGELQGGFVEDCQMFVVTRDSITGKDWTHYICDVPEEMRRAQRHPFRTLGV